MSTLTDMAAGTLSHKGKQYSNNTNIPKEFAQMFMHYASLYDGKPTTATNLSVSDLIGPIRKLLYKIKQPAHDGIIDVANIAKSSIGTILHTGMEEALAGIPGYVQEQRSEIVVDGVTVSGKFDIVTPEGEIRDMKNISAFAYNLFKQDQEAIQPGLSMEEMYLQHPNYFKFVAQLSFYRMLNQELITKPYGTILFNLTSTSFESHPTYSECRMPLFPVEEVMQFLDNKIKLIKQHLADDTMPLCSANERGTKPPSYKLTRMGKGGVFRTVQGSKFDNGNAFREFVIAKCRPGDIEEVEPAKHILCQYCNYSTICDQV